MVFGAFFIEEGGIEIFTHTKKIVRISNAAIKTGTHRIVHPSNTM